MPITPITRSDIQRVAPVVLRRLQAMAQLPPSGTVAGQAVASLMYEELGLDVRGPINDIDVFVDINMPRELRGKSAERQVSKVVRQKTAQAGSAIHSEKDGYGHIKFIAMRTTLKIAHTYRAGLINYTLVSDNNQRTSTRHYWKDPSAHPNPHPDKMSQDIVDGFDLNLVSVGINLASGAAVCSDEFLEFCNTHIIKAQTANTPLHTLIRMASKFWGGQITGAQCLYDQERQKLEAAVMCQKALEGVVKQSFVINSFGAKYQEKCAQFAAHLPPLVEVSRHQSSGKEYVFHAFDLAPEPSSIVEYLADRAPFVDQNVAIQLFLNGFPKMYDLATSANPADNERKQKLINVLHSGNKGMDYSRAAQLFNCPVPVQEGYVVTSHVEHVSDPNLFNDCLSILGRPPVLYDVPNVDPADVAVFFHQQQCVHNPKDVQAAIEFLNSSDEVLRNFFDAFGLKADAAVRWTQDMPKVVGELLLDNCFNLVRHLSNAANKQSDTLKSVVWECVNHAHRVYERNEDVQAEFSGLWSSSFTPLPSALYVKDHIRFINIDPSTDQKPLLIEILPAPTKIMSLVSLFEGDARQQVWEKLLDMALTSDVRNNPRNQQVIGDVAHALNVQVPSSLGWPTSNPANHVLGALRMLARLSVDEKVDVSARFDPVHLIAPLSSAQLAEGSLSEIRHMLQLGQSFQSHATNRVMEWDRTTKDHAAQYLMECTQHDMASVFSVFHRNLQVVTPEQMPTSNPQWVECVHQDAWSDQTEIKRDLERLALMLSVEQAPAPVKRSKM